MKQRFHLFRGRFGPTVLQIGLIVVLTGDVFLAFSATPVEVQAQTQFDESPGGDKAYWQERYRALRNEAAKLRSTAEVARAEYAAANRRNYRRGTNRREQRMIAIDAETELVRVEAELAGLADEARRSGALPGWLREVEDEPAASHESVPAATTADPESDRGRNPLYDDQ